MQSNPLKKVKKGQDGQDGLKKKSFELGEKKRVKKTSVEYECINFSTYGKA